MNEKELNTSIEENIEMLIEKKEYIDEEKTAALLGDAEIIQGNTIEKEDISEDEARKLADKYKSIDDKAVNRLNQEEKLLVKPVYTVHCRICRWADQNISLYNWVSSLAMQGYPSAKLQKVLREYLKEFHPGKKCPTRKSLWTHFTKHLRPADAVALAIAKKEYKPNDGYDPIAYEKELRAAEAGNFNEYTELCKLYTKFRQTHDNIYRFSEALMNRDDWSQNKISTYVSMINTQKAILSEIGKMRQSDKLINIVAEFIIKSYTKNIVERLTQEFQALSTVMEKYGVPGAIMEAYQALTHERLSRILIDEASGAMEETKKEFKLPN